MANQISAIYAQRYPCSRGRVFCVQNRSGRSRFGPVDTLRCNPSVVASAHAAADMIGNLVAKVAARCRAELDDLCWLAHDLAADRRPDLHDECAVLRAERSAHPEEPSGSSMVHAAPTAVRSAALAISVR